MKVHHIPSPQELLIISFLIQGYAEECSVRGGNLKHNTCLNMPGEQNNVYYHMFSEKT